MIFPVLTRLCPLQWKSPPLWAGVSSLGASATQQCTNTKRHIRVIGALIISISALGGISDFRWRYKDKEKGAVEGEGGNHSAASILSGVANEPGMLWELVPAGQILAVVLQHPSTQGSHAGAQAAVPLCSRCPNERFNFNILAKHHFHLGPTLHRRKNQFLGRIGI